MSDEKNAATRHPVFLRPPPNWSELTEEQKHAWALDFLHAAIKAAEPEDRPPLDAQPER